MADDNAQLAKVLHQMQQRIKTLERAQFLRNAAIDAGALQVKDSTGTLRQVIGAQPDGTYTVTDVNGPPPPVPTVPGVFEAPGALRIYWDGTFAVERVAPLDFSRVTVHAIEATEFDPAQFDPLNQAFIVGTIDHATGGEISASLTSGVEYAVVLVAWSLSGRFSGPSEPGLGSPKPIQGSAPESDGNAPQASPTPTIYPGIRTLVAKWEPVANNDPVTYAVHAVAGTDDFTPDASNFIGDTSEKVLPIYALADETPLVHGTSYAVKIVASDTDGPAPAGTVTVGTPAQVTGPDIHVDALSTDMLLANDALIRALQAQTITGVEIEGGEFRTDAGANRIEIGRTPGQIPIGHIWFHSQDLDRPAVIQASSSGTFSIVSGGDLDLTDPNQPAQNAGLDLTGVGPWQDYTSATLYGEAINFMNSGSFTPELNGIALRADNRLLLEALTKVEIKAPTVTINGSKFGDDSGWMDLPGTPGAGISITAKQYRVLNGMVQVRFIGALTGALSVFANGNIGDITIGALPAGARPGGGGLSAASQFPMEISGTVVQAAIYPGGTVSMVYADNRGVAYTIGASGTEISGNSPLYSISS